MITQVDHNIFDACVFHAFKVIINQGFSTNLNQGFGLIVCELTHTDTATGCKDVITPSELLSMKDGAICCNAGHFDVEVDVAWLRAHAVERHPARENIEAFVLENGRTVYVLGEGRLVNLAAGDGHPAEIMDMSFAIQALCAQYLADHRGELAPGVVPVPREIDLAVARRKLDTLGVHIDALSEKQKAYLGID